MLVAVHGPVALPSSATIGYSSVIDFLPALNREAAHEYATILCHTSAITGTNVDIALYGSSDSAGTDKYLLVDAPVADLAKSGSVYDQAGVIDLKAYTAPYYFIGWTSDADEHLNTITVTIMKG
jgi:hypothetical protein